VALPQYPLYYRYRKNGYKFYTISVVTYILIDIILYSDGGEIGVKIYGNPVGMGSRLAVSDVKRGQKLEAEARTLRPRQRPEL